MLILFKLQKGNTMSQDITPSYETATNVLETKSSVSRRYAYWRFRLTYALIIGYASLSSDGFFVTFGVYFSHITFKLFVNSIENG